MKLTTVIVNTRLKTPLWSICQFDTITKEKVFISISDHIAEAIVDFEKGSKDIAPHVFAYKLKSKPLDKNFQD